MFQMVLQKVLKLALLYVLVMQTAAGLNIDERFCKGNERLVICERIYVVKNLTAVYTYRWAIEIDLLNSHLPFVPKKLVSRYMQVLKISNAQLEDITSDDFLYGSSLTDLDLSVNWISLLPQDAFVNIPALRNLNLSYNGLGHLPDNLFLNNKKLETVDFSFNQIHYIPESLFLAKKPLRQIYLANNLVTRIDPDAFLNTTVSSLDVSNNNLTKELEFLRKMPELTMLNLSGNCVGKLKPRTLAKNPKLEQLYLAGSCLTRSFGYGTFPHKSLKELDLSDNKLYYIDIDVFIAIPHLEKLYLRDATLSLDRIGSLITQLSLTGIELAPNSYECQPLTQLVRSMRKKNVELLVREPQYDTQNVVGLTCI